MQTLQQHPALRALQSISAVPAITTGGTRFNARSALIAFVVASQLPMRGSVNPHDFHRQWQDQLLPDAKRCINTLGQKIYINKPEVLELTRKLQQTRTSHSAIYPVLNGGAYTEEGVSSDTFERIMGNVLEHGGLIEGDAFIVACESGTLALAAEEALKAGLTKYLVKADLRKAEAQQWHADAGPTLHICLSYFKLINKLSPVEYRMQQWLVPFLTEAWGNEALAKCVSNCLKQTHPCGTMKETDCAPKGLKMVGFGL